MVDPNRQAQLATFSIRKSVRYSMAPPVHAPAESKAPETASWHSLYFARYPSFNAEALRVALDIPEACRKACTVSMSQPGSFKGLP